jgi:multiple sugar transport system substrate-binding protein
MQNEQNQEQSDFLAAPPQVQSQTPVAPIQAPQPPPQSQAQPQQQQVLPPSQSNPDSSAPPPKIPGRLSGIKSLPLLKILLGLVGLVVIAAVLFFVVTRFLGNQKSDIELVFWGLWEDEKTMQTVLSDFERRNPNIKVNYSKEDLEQYRDRLVTRSTQGNGPDVFLFHNTWYPMISEVLLPVPSSVVSKEDFDTNYFDVVKKDLVKNGAIYGIPQNMDTLVMYVNTDMFRSAGVDIPSNWNDFIDTARGLTVKDEEGRIVTSGAALGTASNIEHSPDIVSLLFLQNGVDINNLEGTSDRAIGALNFYTAFSTDENNVWDESMSPSIVAFATGKLGMYFGYSWDYFQIKAANPDINLQIVPVPQLAAEPINLASYWAAGANSKGKNQKEALEFLKFLTQKDIQAKLYSEQAKSRPFGQPYARVDLSESLKETVIYPSVLQAQYADSSPFVDSAGENGINQELNLYLENAINSINDGTSVESAFDTFKQGVAQVLGRYVQE